MAAIASSDEEPAARWRQLFIVSAGTVLALSPWFSSAAVGPLLAEEWSTSGLELPLLTVAVQLGFAVGAIILAATGAPDVVPGRLLFFGGATIAAVANLGFAVIPSDAATGIPFRLVTGAALAGVYPVAMKALAGWFRRERGAAIGVLIGAVTAGSALPHLFRALGAAAGLDWRSVVVTASIATLLGGIVVLLGARRGPFDVAAPRFSPRIAAAAWREPSVRLANLGYFGHMWELYAMWTWVPLFLAASFAAAGTDDPTLASASAFVVVAAGAIGCIVAGRLADRWGRTTLTIMAMAMSGMSAVAIGFGFGAAPWLVLALAVIWGITVVADSAQFSAAISELSPAGTAGSALSVQVAVGFTLTSVTILGIGLLDPGDATGWRVAFAALALGPAVGIVAMWRLRLRPDAIRMANGHR